MNFQFVIAIAARKKIIPKQNLPEFLHIALLLFYLGHGRAWRVIALLLSLSLIIDSNCPSSLCCQNNYICAIVYVNFTVVITVAIIFIIFFKRDKQLRYDSESDLPLELLIRIVASRSNICF